LIFKKKIYKKFTTPRFPEHFLVFTIKMSALARWVTPKSRSDLQSDLVPAKLHNSSELLKNFEGVQPGSLPYTELLSYIEETDILSSNDVELLARACEFLDTVMRGKFVVIGKINDRLIGFLRDALALAEYLLLDLKALEPFLLCLYNKCSSDYSLTDILGRGLLSYTFAIARKKAEERVKQNVWSHQRLDEFVETDYDWLAMEEERDTYEY
jgi:hypothetical protein